MKPMVSRIWDQNLRKGLMMALRRPSMGSLRWTPQASVTTTHHTNGMHTTVMQHLMRNAGSCAEHTGLLASGAVRLQNRREGHMISYAGAGQPSAPAVWHPRPGQQHQQAPTNGMHMITSTGSHTQIAPKGPFRRVSHLKS